MKSSCLRVVGASCLMLLLNPAIMAEDAAITQFNRAYKACTQALQQCQAKCKNDTCVEACGEKEMDCIEAAEKQYQQNCEPKE